MTSADEGGPTGFRRPVQPTFGRPRQAVHHLPRRRRRAGCETRPRVRCPDLRRASRRGSRAECRAGRPRRRLVQQRPALAGGSRRHDLAARRRRAAHRGPRRDPHAARTPAPSSGAPDVQHGAPPRRGPRRLAPARAPAGRIRVDRPRCPVGCASPPSASAPPTSSSARSSPPARASSPTSWSTSSSGAATRCHPSGSPSSARSSRPTSAGRCRACSPPSTAGRWPRRRSRRSTRATLRTGEEVVVKVQRPRVGELVHADLRVMAWLAPLLVGRIPIAALANPPALVELFAETITEELDFRLEAQNMLDIAAVFAELGQRSYVIPRPHPELVTPRVLVMERLTGFAFDDVVGMQGADIDTEAVVQGRDDRLPRGHHALRPLPRRPARREPVRPPRRAYGAARLRHHRPPRREAPARVPPPPGRRVDERRAWPARRHPRPRRAARRRRPRGDHPRPRPRGPAGRPHDDDARGADRRDPAGHQGPPRLRRAACRRSSCCSSRTWCSSTVPSPRWRPTSTCSPRSPRSRSTSRPPTASASPARSGSTRASGRST